MPVTFQGGYVGGPAPQPLDFSPIAAGLQARNARLDAPQAQRLTEFDLPGIAYLADQGDANAVRFLDRYYGKDQWRQYVPKFDAEANTFTPPEGVPWNWEARDRFERYVLGTKMVGGEGGSQPGGKEAGEQKSPSQAVQIDEQAAPQVEQVTETPPIVETETPPQPPVEEEVTTPPVTTATNQWQRPREQQEIVESMPQQRQAPPPQREVLGYDRDKSINSETPVEWQPNAATMQAIEGLLDTMDQLLQRGVSPQQVYEGLQRSHDPNLLKLRQAIAGTVGPDGKPLTEQAVLDWYQRTYRQGTPGVTDPVNAPVAQAQVKRMQTDLVARMQQQRQAQQQRQQPLSFNQADMMQAPPSAPPVLGPPLIGNPAIPIPQQSPAPAQVRPIDPRTGKPISQGQPARDFRVGAPTEGATYTNRMEGQTVESSPVTGLPEAITQARDAARVRAVDAVSQTEQNAVAEQVRIIDETTGRGSQTTPTLYLGKRAEGIPLHSAAERSTAQHVVKLLTAPPDSSSGKAAAAAIRSTFKRNAPALRSVIQERQQSPQTMVPAGQFARQVYDSIRADPQGMGMYFNELATNYLNAGLTQAQTEYQQSLARESTARAQQQEMTNAAERELGTEYLTAVQRENLKSLQLANQLTELQLGFAPQQLSAQLMETLTAITGNRVNAMVAADMLGYYWAQLGTNYQLGMAQAAGEVQSGLNEADSKRLDQIIDVMTLLSDPENKIDLPEGGEEKFLKEMTAGLTGFTWSGDQAGFIARLFGSLNNFQWQAVPNFQSYQNLMSPEQQAAAAAAQARAQAADAQAETSWASDFDVGR